MKTVRGEVKLMRGEVMRCDLRRFDDDVGRVRGYVRSVEVSVEV